MALEGHATSPLEVPSKVTNRKFVRVPQQEKVVESDEEWERCGKWILASVDADLDFVDGAWTDLQPLVEDGTLIMLKASTLALKHEGAHVHCFTRPGKEEAKRAADAIRKCVDYRGIMYYKLNKHTMQGIARRFGSKQISMYMHTYLGRFYEKDSLDHWILYDEDSNQEEVSVSSQFERKNHSGSQELPSSSPEQFLSLGRIGGERGVAKCYFSCSCSEGSGAYLPEVDRVWIVAKKLFDEGSFTGISCKKNGAAAEINIYASEDCSMLKICDEIFAGASVRVVTYFTRTNGKEFKYKYTAEGELYETTKYSDKFVFR